MKYCSIHDSLEAKQLILMSLHLLKEKEKETERDGKVKTSEGMTISCFL